jgi:hypothetical protein
VVGGGSAAAAALPQLAAAGARITVVAPRVRADVAARAHAVHRRPFAGADLQGAWLAVAGATPAVNADVVRAADARRILSIVPGGEGPPGSAVVRAGAPAEARTAPAPARRPALELVPAAERTARPVARVPWGARHVPTLSVITDNLLDNVSVMADSRSVPRETR